MELVLVRGANDVGSAVAWRLFREGFDVVLHDEPRPAHPRRGMAFADAFHEGECTLADLRAKRARRLEDVVPMAQCHRALPVCDLDFGALVSLAKPAVIVDARMRKHEAPEPLRGLAPFTVGLGPNFVAGGHVDVVVETAWGERLGEAVREGGALPAGGEPRPIEGHARDRFVRSPEGGEFRTRLAIGDRVAADDEVARVGGHVLRAPLAGTLRGLAHDGAEVREGAKVIEVDPRGDSASAFGLGERPARIAGGVLAVLAERTPGP